MHAPAGVDCSHRGGNPGLVRVLDERRLVFPDYSGNNMFQTLGNLSLDSRAGLLFLDFETATRSNSPAPQQSFGTPPVSVTGRGHSDWSSLKSGKLLHERADSVCVGG
jgi:predicted pyridoxine 5'-phosphate oxidase superfamily flavin-nucleotide-binding protein